MAERAPAPDTPERGVRPLIGRRDLGRIAVGLALLATATSAAACSPDMSEPIHFDFARALLEGRWSDAEKITAPDASLALVGLEGSEILKGNKAIVARLREMLIRDRYTFFPDRNAEKEGPIWDRIGGWHLAMMWRKNEVGLYYDESCGSSSDSFQLFVSGSPLRQIVLLQAPPTGAFEEVAVKMEAGNL